MARNIDDDDDIDESEFPGTGRTGRLTSSMAHINFNVVSRRYSQKGTGGRVSQLEKRNQPKGERNWRWMEKKEQERQAKTSRKKQRDSRWRRQAETSEIEIEEIPHPSLAGPAITTKAGLITWLCTVWETGCQIQVYP